MISSSNTRGLKEGYRSGLEVTIANQLDKLNIPYTYEKVKLKYSKPISHHTYTPDFVLDNGIIIESKGRFITADRAKHLLIKQQHPTLDIRFVFTNSKAKISKGSKTTYADWCNKYGFKFADKLIPINWIKESKCGE